MFTTQDFFYLALFFTALGVLIGIGIACWPRSRKSYPNGTALRDATPYHSSWPPDAVVLNEVKVYPSIDVWARENGVV